MILKKNDLKKKMILKKNDPKKNDFKKKLTVILDDQQ